MAHTLATMRNSNSETRRNRKRTLWDRVRKCIRRHVTDEQANLIMKSIKMDLDELIEIGHVEGYQCGVNDTKAAQLRSQSEQVKGVQS